MAGGMRCTLARVLGPSSRLVFGRKGTNFVWFGFLNGEFPSLENFFLVKSEIVVSGKFSDLVATNDIVARFVELTNLEITDYESPRSELA